MEPRRSLTHAARGVLTMIVWLVLTCATAAHAQDDTYRRLAEDATRAMAEHRLEDALSIFREMHAMQPSARTLWSLGRVHHELGRYVIAMGYLDQALLDPRRPLDDAQRQQASELRARAEALTGVLELTVDPADGIVLIDDVQLREGEPTPGLVHRATQVQITNGQERSRLVLELRLDAGDHTVRVERSGQEPSVRRVPIRPGERSRAEIIETGAPTTSGERPAGFAPEDGALAGGWIGPGIPGGQSPEVRLVVSLADDTQGPLTLSLQPFAVMGSFAPIGPREVVCDAPCDVRHARGAFVASVARGGGDAVSALGVLGLTSDSSLVVRYHDETATRVAGAVTVGVLLGYGLLGTILGAVLLESPDKTEGTWLLGTGIGSAVLGLTGLVFAFQTDWAEVSLAPL